MNKSEPKQTQQSVKTKQIFIGIVVLLIVILLVMFGSLLLFMSTDGITSTFYFIAGLILLFGAIFSVKPLPKTNIAIPVTMILLGLYCLARASGIITMPWLMRIAGFASWLAAATIAYIGLFSQNDGIVKLNYK